MDDNLSSNAFEPFVLKSNNSLTQSIFRCVRESETNSQKRELQAEEFTEMASITMRASFLSSGSTITKQSSTNPRRLHIVAKASKATEGERVNVEMNNKEESSNGRRELIFAAAAAAAYSVSKIAMADDEPKAGTPEAKKKYFPVCVTMPTARICRK